MQNNIVDTWVYMYWVNCTFSMTQILKCPCRQKSYPVLKSRQEGHTLHVSTYSQTRVKYYMYYRFIH